MEKNAHKYITINKKFTEDDNESKVTQDDNKSSAQMATRPQPQSNDDKKSDNNNQNTVSCL